MIDPQNLVRLSEGELDFFVYGTNFPVNPSSAGSYFKAESLDDLVRIIENHSWSIVPNAYTEERIDEDSTQFNLYHLYLDEYKVSLEIQARRIYEEMMS